ncbi:hypothetical protein DSO57_1001696 [Entomophthora muscae]|uniref:Uncharacterized protein n=1 Tax=Entomophthora muscae TaxID=34485 RepID=A0ACC2TWN6_9FUNG|nr:hypothetical protein DSO57_1001696 [Entomophthora muscae]
MLLYFFLFVSGFVRASSRQTIFLGLNTTKPQTDGEYVKESLVQIAQWANAAYCSEKLLFSWNCGTPCEVEDHLEVKYYQSNVLSGSALYLGIHEKTSSVVVSYRGTRNVMSFFNDLLAMKLDYRYKSGKVHSGFYRSYSRTSVGLIKFIRTLLADKKYDNYAIIVTGHSYGGALASFLALELKLDDSIKHPVFLRTFEAPRVGDVEFTNFFTKTFFENTDLHLPVLRVTNHNDPVVRLPPTSFGFQHYPHEIWIVDDQVRLEQCQDLFPVPKDDHLCTEDPSCSVSKMPWNLKAHTQVWDINFAFSCKI